jgi:hypothetical protein
MKQKLNSLAGAALRRIRPDRGRRTAFRCLMMFVVAGLLNSPKTNAQTQLSPGTTKNISSFTETDFPLNITSNGTYTIEGNYNGDYGEPLGYKGEQLALTQSAERINPTASGVLSIGATKHGIVVEKGLKDVTVILKNVAIVTSGVNNAAFLINGMSSAIHSTRDTTYTSDTGTTYTGFQGHSEGSNVVVRLEGKNILYSGNMTGTNRAASNRAGLEVWKGSTVYIEGNGYLLAKSSVTRNFNINYSTTTTVPRLATDEHPQGSPYWNTNNGNESIKETDRSNAYGNRSGAAGIGAGDVSGSGGNVVIRGDPKVIAIAAAHGAGIGGAWTFSSSTNGAGMYFADILIYGGTVESWGGQHGAGIGGGCAGGSGTIVVLPTASVYSASYDPVTPMLGKMTNVIYFGNPEDSRLALYTEDYREVDMFLDMSKNAAVRAVIERLGGGMNSSYLPLGKTRDNWPETDLGGQHRPNYTEWAADTDSVIPRGPGKYVLLLNGGFLPAGINVAFLTAAKTEKNHSYNPVSTTVTSGTVNQYQFKVGNTNVGTPTYGLNKPTTVVPDYNIGNPQANHYAASASGTLRPVLRFVMIAPTYIPSVSLTPPATTPPELIVGYPVDHANNKITLTIGNSGNQKLYNPKITIIGDDYELYGGSIGSLQEAVEQKLLGLLSNDADGKGDYIDRGASFKLELRLKEGKSPGTSYNGWVLFSAANLPNAPKPIPFKINVFDKFLQPPDLVMEMPTDTVVSGSYQLRAKFKDQLGAYGHPVRNLKIEDIFIDYGTVTKVEGASLTEGPGGYFHEWIIYVTPTPGLPNKSTVSVAVKQGAAEDEVQASTQTISKPKLVTFSSEGPYVLFNVAEGAVLSSLDTLLVNVNGNGITPGKEDSIYVNDRQFTEPEALTDGTYGLQKKFMLTQLSPIPNTLIINATGQYELSVTDENNLKIGSPSPVGFPNGEYKLEIPDDYIRNYDGNKLPYTKLSFSIQMPEVPDGSGEIIPATLGAAGGNVRIWVSGKHLLAAKGKLIIVFPTGAAIPGYTSGQEVYVPSAQFTDTTAYIDVTLPPNLSDLPQPYNFTIRLIDRKPLEYVPSPSPPLTATVNPASAVIDTTKTALGYREGLHAWPHTQTFEGGPVDLRLVGENLFLLNQPPNANLRIRVKKDGSYISTVIPVPTPSALGAVEVPLGVAFTAEKNLSPNDAVYVFELWYDAPPGGTPTPVPEYSTGGFVSDSTTVKSGLDDLIKTLRGTHHIVSQRVANTAPDVRTWLVPRLNVIDILRSFGLTVSENDITFTDFVPAVEGTMALPRGSNGYFVFTLTLNTSPVQVVTLNTGEIEAASAPPVMLEREVLMPEVPGYITDPPVGDYHIESGKDFTFYLIPVSDETRMITPRVTTDRRFGSDAENITVESVDDGLYYIVTIHQIRESITIRINEKEPEDANGEVAGTKAWGEHGRLHIRSVERGRATVYNTLGATVATVALEAGEAVAVPLPAGIYLVSLHGETYRALVK